ncbi:hypothetical protein OEG84_00730 [Hoeflea sp. G2-23]|uniref:Uncharacterized protein n=1 Tax=Hoeflea algicola TaxID=2983763 RepID=A0ABT3Z3D1_9HYPH|nr:hypothetical protein [Hoeflea algicola]MCY0146278.1 hypothetical protein [Hoeflea algicola]
MNRHPQPEGTFWPVLAYIFAPEIRAWHGKATLATAFWFYGVFTSSIMILFYARLIYLRLIGAEQVLLLLLGLYTVWILISIWRCSLAEDSVWAQFARFLTVAWAGNIALVLTFRQIELLSIFAGVTGNG